MAVAVTCPHCHKQLKAPEQAIGKRAKCPHCQHVLTVPAPSPAPEDRAQARPQEPTAGEPSQRIVATEAATATGARWNFLFSVGWLVLGWSIAWYAPWLAVHPAWLEALGNLLPLLVTAGLIGWNFAASLRILGRTARALAALPLTALQVLLFVLLFYQLACHQGAEHYVWDRVPGLLDWIALVVVHALRAADVLDGIEAYGLSFQAIHNASDLTAWILIFFHLVIHLFFLRLLMEVVGRRRRSMLEAGTRRRVARWATLTVIGGFVAIWLFSALFWRPWFWSDLVLWPVDNLLRVVDFVDVMEIYQISLHRVPRLPWEGTLTLACRLLMAVGLAGLLAWGVQEVSIQLLGGRGLDLEELRQLALNHPDKELRAQAAKRGAEVARLREHAKRVRWPAGVEVLATLGPACVLALFVFIGGSQDAIPRLVELATGPDDRQAERALGALRRLGPRADAAVAPLDESLPQLAPARRLVALETLGYLGPSAAEVLGKWLQQGDEQTRQAVFAALQRIGPRGVPIFLQGLRSQAAEVRDPSREAIEAIGRDAVQPLLDHLVPADAAVVLELLEQLDPYWRLRSSRNPHASALLASCDLIPRLQKATTETELREVGEELIRLGPIGMGFASRELCKDLYAKDKHMRLAAIQLLQRSGHLPDVAIPALSRIAWGPRSYQHHSLPGEGDAAFVVLLRHAPHAVGDHVEELCKKPPFTDPRSGRQAWPEAGFLDHLIYRFSLETEDPVMPPERVDPVMRKHALEAFLRGGSRAKQHLARQQEQKRIRREVALREAQQAAQERARRRAQEEGLHRAPRPTAPLIYP